MDIANDVACAGCSHLGSAHADVDAGQNSGACTMKGCDCAGMDAGKAPAPAKAPAKASSGSRRFVPAPAAPAAPAPDTNTDTTPATDDGDSTADVPTLLQTVSDSIEAALSSLSSVDIASADPATQTFIALVHAADNSLDIMTGEITADDDAGSQSDLALTVDACIVAARNAAATITAPSDDVAAAIAAVADADEASGDVLEALGAPDPDRAAGTDPDTDDEAGLTAATVSDTVPATDGPASPSDPGGPAEQQKFRMPIMVIEGVDTGDGRFITPSCLTWRDLPFPVMAITKTTMGHDEAELVGRVDTIERISLNGQIDSKTGEPYPDGTTALEGTGVFASIDEATRISGLIKDQFLRGVSVDIGDVKSVIEFLDDNGNPIPEEPDDEEGDIFFFLDGEIRETLTEGRVMGVTICPFPAFEGAYIELDDGTTTPQTRDEASDGAPEATVASIVNVDEYGMRECIPCKEGGPLVASAGPTAPPAEWFASPNLDGPTPLTITDDGRIYGHLATWGTCHTGVNGRCVTAPHSKTNYGYFRTGAVKCADGSLVATGPITLGGGHAGLPLGPSEAIAHYDEAGMAVADVASGEDRHGVWVAGAMRPDVTPAQVRNLRASALSGDWRAVGGNLELVAALAVNAPGFPIVRSQVASGAPVSLVAAGARQVVLAAQSRAHADRAMLDEMRAQWPVMQTLLNERNERAAALRTKVRADRLRHAVHGKRGKIG